MMTVRYPSPSRLGLLLGLGLGLAVVLGACRIAPAQSIGVDPYDPWNAMYRPFVFPITPVNPAVPNASRMDIIGAGRRLYDVPIDRFSGDDLFERSWVGGSRFQPYYRSRTYDPYRRSERPSEAEADRMYIPNRGDTFYENQQERERRFFEALRQRDPRRRAEMLRQIDEERRAAARPSATVRGRTAPESLPESGTPEATPNPFRPGGRRSPSERDTGALDSSTPGLGLMRNPGLSSPLSSPGDTLLTNPARRPGSRTRLERSRRENSRPISNPPGPDSTRPGLRDELLPGSTPLPESSEPGAAPR